MFEKEIKYISDFNINKIRKLGAFFTLDGLASARVHPAIFQYISAELDYLFYRDRKRIIKQSLFDYTLPEVSPHFNAIGDIIKQHKLLPFEDIKELVVQAVQFNVHLLLRPKATLSRFIFGEDEEKSAEEVQILLRYLYYYDFYRKVTSEFLEKKKILKFRYEEFESVVNNLTRLLVESQTQAMIDTALTSMADFFNAGDVNKSLIPVAAVEMYLKEKNLGMYISKIRTILSTDMKRRFEVDDFKNAMYSNIAISLDRELREKLNQELAEEYNSDSLSSIERGRFSFGSGASLQTPEQEEIDYAEPSGSKREEDSISLDELLDESETPAAPPVIPQPGRSMPAEPVRFPEGVEEEDSEPHSGLKEMVIPEEEKKESSDQTPASQEIDYTDSRTPAFTITIPEFQADQTLSAENNIYTSPSAEDIPAETAETLPEELTSAPAAEVPVSIQVPEPEAEPEKQPDDEEEEEEPARDLFSYFSTRETMRVVEEIFNNDSLDFVSTMESVAECENFEQAQTLLKSVFYTYKINTLTSKEANLLTAKIEEYFRGGK